MQARLLTVEPGCLRDAFSCLRRVAPGPLPLSPKETAPWDAEPLTAPPLCPEGAAVVQRQGVLWTVSERYQCSAAGGDCFFAWKEKI